MNKTLLCGRGRTAPMTGQRLQETESHIQYVDTNRVSDFLISSNRIIVHGREIISSVVPGSAQPFNFKESFHLTEQEVNLLPCEPLLLSVPFFYLTRTSLLISRWLFRLLRWVIIFQWKLTWSPTTATSSATSCEPLRMSITKPGLLLYNCSFNQFYLSF